MWLTLLIIIALALMAAGFAYILWRVTRFSFVRKLTQSKVKARIGAALIFLAVFGILVRTSNLINSAMIFLHLLLIWMVSDFIGWLINRSHNRQPGEKYIAGTVAVIVTIIVISVGYFCCYHVFRTDYALTTHKDLGTEKLRIVGWGDSHLGNTVGADNFDEIIARINAENPDMVVIVGDYIDDDSPKEDMEKCTAMLKDLKTRYGVYCILGNHDIGYYDAERKGYGEKELIEALQASNVTVLSDEVLKINDHITLIGREDIKNTDRHSIDDLMAETDAATYIIDLNHRPDDYANEAAAEVDLVLSGHTHGGQFFPASLFRSGPLTFVNDRNYGWERRGHTDFIVTSGLSDWNLKFKTGAISEYFVVDVQPE